MLPTGTAAFLKAQATQGQGYVVVSDYGIGAFSLIEVQDPDKGFAGEIHISKRLDKQDVASPLTHPGILAGKRLGQSKLGTKGSAESINQ